jgi:hypothetical protein
MELLGGILLALEGAIALVVILFLTFAAVGLHQLFGGPLSPASFWWLAPCLLASLIIAFSGLGIACGATSWTGFGLLLGFVVAAGILVGLTIADISAHWAFGIRIWWGIPLLVAPLCLFLSWLDRRADRELVGGERPQPANGRKRTHH